MAFGASTSSSPSFSSTLSPLAPPFPLPRAPAASYDCLPSDPPRQHTGPLGPDRTWLVPGGPVRRTLSNDLVQAEPFYPQYESGIAQGRGLDANYYGESSVRGCVGRGTGTWNSHFVKNGVRAKDAGDGDGVGFSAFSMGLRGTGAGESRWSVEDKKNAALGKTQSCIERGVKEFPVKYAAASQQSNVTSDNSAHYDRIQSGSPFESFEQQTRLPLERSDWLGNGTSGYLWGGSGFPSKVSVTSGPHQYQSAITSLSGLSCSLTSSEGCNIFDPASSMYNSSIVQSSPGKTEQVGYYPGTTNFLQSQKCSPAPCNTNASIDKSILNNAKSCVRPMISNKDNDKQMYQSQVKPTNTVISPSVVIKESYPSNDQEIHDLKRGGASSLLVEKKRSLSVSDDTRNLSGSNSEVKTSCLNARESSENKDFFQNSSEALEKLGLAVDSPCWKGALSFRYSPFQVNDASVPDHQLKTDVSVKETATLTASNENEGHFTGNLNEKNDVLLPSDSKSGHHAGENDVILTTAIGKNISLTTQPLAKLRTANLMPIFEGSAQCAPSCLSSHVLDEGFSSFFCGPYQEDDSDKKCDGSNLMEYSLPSADIHFLVSSLHNLSTYLFSYCTSVKTLRTHDCELLSSAINKLNACLSEKALQEETSFQHQLSDYYHPRNHFGPLAFSNLESDRFLGQKNDKLKDDTAVRSMNSFKPAADNDKSCLNGDFNIKKSNEMTKEFEKGLKKLLSVKEDNAELDLYKKLWIKAEVALCSAKQELQLCRMSILSGKCGEQMMTTDIGCLYNAERENASEVNTTTMNFTRTLTNASLPKAGETLFKNSNGSEYDASQGGSEKPQRISNVLADVSDIDASVMARYRVIKNRINESDSRTIEHQNDGRDLAVTGPLKESFLSSLMNRDISEAKFQRGRFETIPERNPWTFCPHELQDRGQAADNGQCVGTDNRSRRGHGETNLGFEARPTFSTYLPSVNLVKKPFPGKYGGGSSDWEHVLKEELTL